MRLVAMPPCVEMMDDETDELQTKQVFRQCVGHVFRVRGIDTGSSLDDGEMLELLVWKGRDAPRHRIPRRGYSYPKDTIWVEPEYVELVVSEENRAG